MEFIELEPNDSLSIRRYQSTSGIWEFGLRRMIFGIRVSIFHTGDICYQVDYCGGSDIAIVVQLFQIVETILQSLPETISRHELVALFPIQKVKPIEKDPECWQQLQNLAHQLK